MFIQTEITPNPNALKFIPGKTVSNSGSLEFTKKEDIDNELVRNLLSINGVTGIFLGTDFLSINKNENISWEDIKHIAISLINDFYSTGKKFVIANELFEKKKKHANLALLTCHPPCKVRESPELLLSRKWKWKWKWKWFYCP